MPEKEPYDIATGDIYTTLCMYYMRYSPEFFMQVEDTYRQFFNVYHDELEVCEQWSEENNDRMKQDYEHLELMKKNRETGQPYTNYFMPLSRIAAQKYAPLNMDNLMKEGIYPFDLVRYDYNFIVLRERHKPFFDYFFGLELITTPIMSLKKFLNHHLKRNFNNNVAEYKEYLETILVAEVELIERWNRGVSVIVNRYIQELIFATTQDKTIKNSNMHVNNLNIPHKYDINTGAFGMEKEKDLRLSNMFKTEELYKGIMDLLVKEKYCQPLTHIWKDEKKGNKSLLVAIIKYLHKHGYYKENECPTNKQIQIICKNTFALQVGIDTINKVKYNSFDLSFIPVAPSVK